MNTRYVVIDPEGACSLGGKNADLWESFKTYRAAERRAKQLAAAMPGQVIGICELVGEVVVPLAKTESTRKYPIEHYK
jgi:hypothetical protein